MCTSVPQIVVVVILMTASPARGTGLGTSSTAIRSLLLKTTAFMVFMTTSRMPRDFPRRCSGRRLRGLHRFRDLDLRCPCLEARRHGETDLENTISENCGDVAHLDAFR